MQTLSEVVSDIGREILKNGARTYFADGTLRWESRKHQREAARRPDDPRHEWLRSLPPLPFSNRIGSDKPDADELEAAAVCAAVWNAHGTVADKIRPVPENHTIGEAIAVLEKFGHVGKRFEELEEWAMRLTDRDAPYVASMLRVVREARKRRGVEGATVPPLNDTDQRALNYIKENPGMPGDVIAKRVERTFEHFRRSIVPKLKAHGVTNDGTDGYHFRKPASV